MKMRPNRVYLYFLGSILLSFCINLSCSKDTDTLRDAVLKDTAPTIKEVSEQVTENQEEPVVDEVNEEDEIDEVLLETRTTVFSPIHDAHIQNGKGFNQNIVRLEENRRTSYLMFDLSPIDSIGGQITKAALRFTIDSDDGSGKISVYSGTSSDWSENDLSDVNAPQLGPELGTLIKEYQINKTEVIQLSPAELQPKVYTFVLVHKDGNDLAFASKEHPENIGPALIVDYQVPEGTEQIAITEGVIAEEEGTIQENDITGDEEETVESENTEPSEESVQEENAVEEEDTTEVASEETTEEEPSQEENTEEEQEKTTEEETLQEETSEEEQEETTEEETLQEETSEEEQEETTEEETPQEETSEEEQEETTEEETPQEETSEEEQEETTEEEPTQEETSEEEQEGIEQEENTEEEPEEENPNQGGSAHTNEAPMAVADATPSSGSVPLKVTFEGSNSSDDTGVTRYSWDFKDGTKATEANPIHTFSETGSYEVELTVEDSEGLTDIDIVTITVKDGENNAPIAKIGASPLSGEAPLMVLFKGDGSTDDNMVTGYAWDFKDGASATNANPEHTFSEPGSYTVELTVKDEQGLSDKETVVITVSETKNEAPVAKASANPTSGTIPLKVQFTGNTSTDDVGITEYSWDFKDGQKSIEENPSHTFTEPGVYAVELTVKDKENLSSTQSVTITANAPQNQAPIANASANRTSGDAPLQVQFMGDSSTDDEGITSYSWNFKDGATSTEINPSHTFQDAGFFAVELTVVDAAGQTDTATLNITINQTSTGNAPDGSYFVTTSGSSNNDGLSEASAWSIEHAFQNAKAGDHVYIKAGNYGNVRLQPGNSGTAGKPIKFIGYRQQPGDIVAVNGSTFQYGDQLDANKMPLIKGNRINNEGQGSGIFNFHKYIEISNIQITHYEEGVFSSGEYTVLDNIIATEIGDFNPAHTYPNNTSNPSLNYAGVGIKVSSDHSIIKNCFVLNAGAEGYRFSNCQNQKQSYNKVYSDSQINPCDYYYLLSIDAVNNDVSNIYVERVGDLEHLGHGLVLKFNARNNTIRNSTVKNTWLELSYSGVADNQFTNCTVVGGSNNQGALLIANGAHHNSFNQCRVTRCDGVAFADWDEDFSRGDVRDAGHHNTFNQCTFDNNLAGVFFFWYSQDNTENLAHDNTFDGCTFRDMDNLFLVDRANSNTLLKNCNMSNITSLRDSYLPTLHSGIPLRATYQNNTLQNCGFTLN